MIGSAALSAGLSRMPSGCCVMPHGGLMETGSPFGGLIRITPKVIYSFQPASSAIETHVLAKYVDSTMWVSSVLVVRVHARSLAAGQSVAVLVHNVSFAEEDPAQDILESAARATATITSGSPSAVPSLVPVQLTAPIAGMLRVSVQGTQAAGVTSVFSVTIGVDLIGRPA